MSKIVPIHDIGVPVPSPAPDPSVHLIVYYGAKGFTPAYEQTARIDAGPVSGLSTVTKDGASYYDDPIGAELPSGLSPGDYDVYFTLMSTNGAEGDFSPVLTVTIDTAVPPTLGQPIEL